MDWAKAKTIMIVALLATNLILLLSYGVIQNPALQKNNDQYLIETMNLLEKNKIFVNTAIPEHHEKMPVLFVKYDQPEDEKDKLKETLNSQVIKQGSEDPVLDARNQAEQVLEELGWLDQSVVFSEIKKEGNGYQIHYRNQINNLPLEESTLDVTVVRGRVTEVDRSWLLPLGYGEGKKEIMTAAAALLKLINEKDPVERIDVEEIQLVYWLDPAGFGAENTVSDTAFPAWKITNAKGETRYYNAYQE